MANEFADILAAEGLTLEATPKKLEGNDSTLKAGTFVLNGQTIAVDDGFRNVSKIWFDQTLTFKQGLEKLEEQRLQTLDITATVQEMVPNVDKDGVFAFYHKPSDKYYRPTQHAMGQIGIWADTGTWYVQNMLENPTDYKNREKYARDRQDSETLAKVLSNGFRRLDQKKKFFFRCRKDGTMRAMLTERYAQVDNRWFVELLSGIVPGGRLSHWKGDADTIYGNILIPDSIRAETDSEYGGMLSIGNSEIGERRISSRPSIFRAICMNGCIWGQTKGEGIKRVHRGKINLDAFAIEIKKNLNDQIPLIATGIDKFLKTRVIGCDGTSMKPVFAQLAKQFKWGRKEASDVLNAWHVESKLTPDLGSTLFGVINAITRAGQEQQSPAKWVDFDTYGGELMDYSKDDFSKVVSRAKSLDVEEVEEMFVALKA